MDFFLSFVSYGVTGVVYRIKWVVGVEGRCDLVRILFTGGACCLEFCSARRLLLMSAPHLVALSVAGCFSELKQNLQICFVGKL
jgi:hypothetical protein